MIVDGSTITGRKVVRADACVIGSGAGGAVVAKELAEGGMRVVILEEGAHHATEAMTARPRDMISRLYRDAGQAATIGTPPILLPLGKAVGGTTLVNSGTCFRTPAAVLARWREDGLDGLEPFFDRVERELNVTPVAPELAGRNAAIARRGAERLGWSGGYVRRNVRGCRGSGVCAFGCPTGAKQHVGATYLPKAWNANATTFAATRATRVRTGRVDARTAGGGRLRIGCDVVVVAAGALHTPGLLARSPHLGRHLSIHPATAIWGLFDEEVDMARGVPQSYYVDEFADQGIMLEGIAGPPDYLALNVPFAGARHRELMLRYRHVAQFGLMVSDRSRGRVLRRGLVRYDLGSDDVETIRAGLERLVELFWAAGARAVFLPIAGCPELPRDASLPHLRARDLKLMAFHPLGTARAHADRCHGVVDADLAVHGTPGVHVADGSVVPSPPGVNPQITIMALATRLAFHLCRS